MSRNLKYKPSKPVPARKTAPKPSASSTSSDDDDYAELDELTDSDDEEPDVELAEEQAIIASEAAGSDYEEDADDESNDEDAPQPEDDDDNAESFNGFPDDTPTPNDFFNEQLPPHIPRRVRFNIDIDEVSHSSGSDNDSSDYGFPDLMAEDELDPTFRQSIQNDDDGNDDGSDTFWDWENATANYDIEGGDVGLSNISSDEDSSSSGYGSG
jgi:hypothetical protein